jgi:hypothetical protein
MELLVWAANCEKCKKPTTINLFRPSRPMMLYPAEPHGSLRLLSETVTEHRGLRAIGQGKLE